MSNDREEREVVRWGKEGEERLIHIISCSFVFRSFVFFRFHSFTSHVCATVFFDTV